MRRAPGSNRWSITGHGFEAVENGFAVHDTSFLAHLNAMEEMSAFDPEIKERCLIELEGNEDDPNRWDAAVRASGIVLETRIRDVGGIPNQLVGRELVKAVFGKDGRVGRLFESNAERESHLELYAGALGVFRNPSAHRFLNPSPEQGTVVIAFINLLVGKLEDLREEASCR